MNLNQVTVPAMDVAASIEFYCRLGLRLIVDAQPRYARFECPDGHGTFSVHRIGETVGAPGPQAVVYFECEDLDARVAALKGMGVCFFQDPRDEPWLWREARLRDPSHNEICLYWAGEARRYPPWRVPHAPTT